METENLESAIPSLDILYMTRIQRERFDDQDEYLRLKDSYILTPEHLVNDKKEMAVLHPLPRVNEITLAVDDDERAKYFEQAGNGVYVRMALIITMLNLKAKTTLLHGKTYKNVACKNPNCITCSEKYLPKSFISIGDTMLQCEYCSERLLLER